MKSRNIFLGTYLFFLLISQVYGQSIGVNIKTTNAALDPSAILDIANTGKGLLIPRISTIQRTNILSPAAGLMVYDIDTKSFWYFDAGWKEIITTLKEVDPIFEVSEANKITNSGSGKVITDAERAKLNSLSASNDTFKISTRYVDKGGLVMPVGSIIAYAGSTLPKGWLWCNGDPQSATKYHDLYDAIGIAWGGIIDVSFNVPDLRGRFLRGVDGTANVDPDKSLRTKIDGTTLIGNIIGSYQSDFFKTHSHTATVSSSSTISVSGATVNDGAGHIHTRGGNYASGMGSSSSGDYILYNSDGGSMTWNISASIHSHTFPLSGTTVSGTHPLHSATIYDTGDNETRPKNVYVNYIIKY